jgi:putative transposase
VTNVGMRGEASTVTLYNLKAKYGGMEVSEPKRLKAVKDEIAKPKRLLLERTLVAVLGLGY